MTKRSAKIWLAPLNHSNMICAHPELIRANAETVKSLLLIVTLHAWLGNINRDSRLILDSTRPAPINGNSCFRKSQKIKVNWRDKNFMSGKTCKLWCTISALYLSTFKCAQAHVFLFTLNTVSVKGWLRFIARQSYIFPQLNRFNLLGEKRNNKYRRLVVLLCWHLCIWQSYVCMTTCWDQLIHQITSFNTA